VQRFFTILTVLKTFLCFNLYVLRNRMRIVADTCWCCAVTVVCHWLQLNGDSGLTEKQLRRREQNRRAATKCRHKRRAEFQQLKQVCQLKIFIYHSFFHSFSVPYDWTVY